MKTGKAMTAGTDANVYLIIYGANGRTVKHHLDNRRKNDFERNTTSEFTVRFLFKILIDNEKFFALYCFHYEVSHFYI